MATTTFYGLGGYDPEKPNNNIIRVEEIPDDETLAPATIENKLDAVIAAVTALADNRPTDAADAIATLATTGE